MYRIAVMPGDGTGPEVVCEGLKVLKAVSEEVNFTYETVQFDFGGEHYKKTGETLPDSALNDLRKYRCHLSGCHRTSRCKTGHTGKGDSSQNQVFTGPVHQPEAR